MPVEVHEHFDADETLTGRTIVHRESPWNDETRDRAIALYQYEADMCGCGCNQPAAESHQPGAYVVHKATCYAGKALDVVRRMDREAHEEDDRPGWDDGLHWFVLPSDAPIDPKE